MEGSTCRELLVVASLVAFSEALYLYLILRSIGESVSVGLFLFQGSRCSTVVLLLCLLLLLLQWLFSHVIWTHSRYCLLSVLRAIGFGQLSPFLCLSILAVLALFCWLLLADLSALASSRHALFLVVDCWLDSSCVVFFSLVGSRSGSRLWLSSRSDSGLVSYRHRCSLVWALAVGLVGLGSRRSLAWFGISPLFCDVSVFCPRCFALALLLALALLSFSFAVWALLWLLHPALDLALSAWLALVLSVGLAV